MNLADDQGRDLLADLSIHICRFVNLSLSQARVCALWTVHTHVSEASDFTPYLDINSPVLRSGKTRLLEVLKLIVRNPWFTGRVSGSALVRKLDKDHPTLLLDESDAAFQTRGDYGEALRGILNAGFERDGTYSMSVPKGNDWEPRDFKTFSPKAIAGIGHLPATIRDRSITIRLKRARREEHRERFRKAKVKPEAEQIRQRVEEWAKLNGEKLREIHPELPDELNDRQQDVCEPLLAIAEVAGGGWPAMARAALIELCTGLMHPDDSTSLNLLVDIRQVFAQLPKDRIPTLQLLDSLRHLQESPWGEFDHGRPLTAFQLAKLLRPFEVRPRDIRFEQTVQKGYMRADFEDSWNRYLDPPSVERDSEGQQAQQVSILAGSQGIQEGQHKAHVASAKNVELPVNTRVVANVAPSSPLLSDGNDESGGRKCRAHPSNKTDWWLLGGVDQMCGLCHPDPD